MDSFYVNKQVQAIRLLHSDILSRAPGSLTIEGLLSTQAQTILRAHQRGSSDVIFHLTCWCPDYIGRPASEIVGADVTLEQARLSMAREYGYSDWADVESIGSKLLDAQFEHAVDSLVHGRIDELRAALQSAPGLLSQRSPFGHQATLLHYIGANGVETQRQVTPYNAVELTHLLLDNGADVNAVANMYGGATVLGLVETSAHPRNAGVTDQLVVVLRSYGAT